MGFSAIAKTLLDLVDGGRAILRDERDAYREENLICLNADGSSRWTASLPKKADRNRFVTAALEGNSMRANSWSGWIIWFDCTTGEVLKTAFRK